MSDDGSLDEAVDAFEYFSKDSTIISAIYDRWEKYGKNVRMKKYFLIPITIRAIGDSARLVVGDKSYDTEEELFTFIKSWEVGVFAADNLSQAIWSCRDQLTTMFLIELDGDYSAHVATFPAAIEGTIAGELVYEVSVDKFDDMEQWVGEVPKNTKI